METAPGDGSRRNLQGKSAPSRLEALDAKVGDSVPLLCRKGLGDAASLWRFKAAGSRSGFKRLPHGKAGMAGSRLQSPRVACPADAARRHPARTANAGDAWALRGQEQRQRQCSERDRLSTAHGAYIALPAPLKGAAEKAPGTGQPAIRARELVTFARAWLRLPSSYPAHSQAPLSLHTRLLPHTCAFPMKALHTRRIEPASWQPCLLKEKV